MTFQRNKLSMGQMLDSLLRKGVQPSKCKSLLERTILHVNLLKREREKQCELFRMDVMQLLQKGQDAGACSMVEHVFKEQNMVDAYLLIEEFCTAVMDKMASIEKHKTCPNDLKEAISSLCFAASRCTDLPELQQLRSLFSAKYGKEFTTAASELILGCTVNKQIIEKLSIRSPSRSIKSKLIKEIAAQNVTERKFENLLDGPNNFLAARQINLQSAYAARPSSVRESTKGSREFTKSSMQLQTDYAVTQPDSLTYFSPPSPPIPSLDDDGFKDDKQFVSFAKKGLGKLFNTEQYDSQCQCPPFHRRKESAVYPKPAGNLDSDSSEDEPYTRPRMGSKTVYHEGTKTLNSTAPKDHHRSTKFSEVNGLSVGSVHEKIKYTDAVAAAQAAFKSAAHAAAAARVAVSLARNEYNRCSSQSTDYSSEDSSECDDGLDEPLFKETNEDRHRNFIHGLEKDIDDKTSVRSGAYKYSPHHQDKYYDIGEEHEGNDITQRINAHINQERIETKLRRSMAMAWNASNLTNQSFPFREHDKDEVSSVRSGYQNTLKGKDRRPDNEDLTRRSSLYSTVNLPQFCGYHDPDKYANSLNRRPYQKQDYIHVAERGLYRSKSQMRVRPGMSFKDECESPRSQRSISTSRLSKPSSNRDFVRGDDYERIKLQCSSKTPMPRRSQQEDDYGNYESHQCIGSKCSDFLNSDNEGVHRYEGAGKLSSRSGNLKPVNEECPKIDLTRPPKSLRHRGIPNLAQERQDNLTTNPHAAIPTPPRLFDPARKSVLSPPNPTPIM